MKAMIDILMSTYNGGRFVEQQIDSIIAQTFTDWRLLIRDDGSSDGTAEIVSRYADLHRERICLIESNGENLGACQSFARLLEGADADYMMFSDQDDVWLPDKLARQVEYFELSKHPRFEEIFIDSLAFPTSEG